jgi:uncharacterized protein (TIGR03437 family)
VLELAAAGSFSAKCGRQSIRGRSDYRSGLLAVLLAAAGAMLSGQIVHPLAQPRYDQGPVASTFHLGYIQMMLQPAQAQREALDQLLAAQRDPSSPSYHNWLTPEQYADRFGLSRTDLARVTAWLRTSGFTIESTARGRDWIAFSGTAAQVEAAFHAPVHRYTIGSETHFAVATEPVIPSELSPLVATILGLNDFYPKSMMKPAYTSGYGVLASPSLAPGDLTTIYDINALHQQGIDGSGQNIVIVGQHAINISDIQQFRESYGLAAGKITLVQNGTPGTNPDDEGEADLDLEWAGAIAPNATLIYVYGADADSAAFYAIDQNLAPVVSESFGNCEANVPPLAPAQYEAEAKKGNALGITWIAAGGDSGAAACDPHGAPFASYGLAVNFPASVPEITAVGGTEFQEGNGNYWSATNGANGGSALGYIPEMAWNDTGALSDLCNYPPLPLPNGAGAAPCPGLAATGGGVSMLFPKPSWQIGPGVPADGQRDVPDVAFAASDLHDPYNIVTSGQTMQVGGTSASTPVFAGILALLNQELKSSGVGNINATLYGLALSSPSMFHDIVNNNNIVPCACESGEIGYNAGIAYDLTTGLGSVDTSNLVTGWSAATASAAAPVISSVANAASYAAGIVSPGEMVVISGTGLGPAQLGGLALSSSGLVSTQYSTNTLMSVQFNGFAAPLVYTSSTAIAVVVPYEVAGSTAQVTVTYQGRTSAPVTMNIAPAVPGIFTANGSGSGQAAAYNSDGRTLNSSATPAAQGSTIILYGTGEGQTSPAGVDGKLATASLPTPMLPVSVTIGGVPAGVQYAGAAYGEVAGMLQINVVVPSTVSGSALPVVVQVGNTMSQAGVTIAVAPPAFAITSQEIVGSVVSTSNVTLACSAPPAKSSFLTTDPVVWVYFAFSGAQDGDVLVANWLHPSGQLDADQPSLTLNYSGSGCAAAPLNISGTEVAQDPGNWQMKLFRNGAFQFALPFTIVP